jgi:hypothetical protein
MGKKYDDFKWVLPVADLETGVSECKIFDIYMCILHSLLFGPKRDEVTGGWRKLHNEELSDLYSLPNIVRVVKSRSMRQVGHVARMGERRGLHRVLVGKTEGNRKLGRPRRRWEDNINWIFRK